MVQKIAGQYLVKSLKDTLLAPPPAPSADAGEPVEEVETVADDVSGDGLPDVINLTDDDGNEVGRALRVRSVAVYVVTRDASIAADELQRALNDLESTEVLFHSEDDQIVGIIYSPDPAGAPEIADVIRADDI